MASYTRQSDGASVTEDEAMLNGVLKQGYALHSSVWNRDATLRPAAIMMHDTATRFMDQLPTAQAARINEVIADAGSSEIFRVQRARQAARDLSCMLGGAACTNQSLTTDGFKRAHLEGSAFLMALADQAWEREHALYASDGGLHAAAARTAMQDRDATAWQRPTGQQGDSQTTADAATPLGDAATEHARMRERDANAWSR